MRTWRRYLYYALQNMHFISTDVAVPGLNRDLAYSRPLLLPPVGLRARFLEVAAPIHEQVDTLSAMNRKLRTARDLLLPRLMSGELTVGAMTPENQHFDRKSLRKVTGLARDGFAFY